MTITVEEAVEILRILGSDIDPIYVSGVETTASDHEQVLDRTAKAEKIHLSFHGKRSRVVEGTLASMVMDRMGGPPKVKRLRRVGHDS